MASSIGGADLVQAYVMGKLHKEKMERISQQEPRNTKAKENQGHKSGSGFFRIMRKKVHPNGASKPAEEAGSAGVPTASR